MVLNALLILILLFALLMLASLLLHMWSGAPWVPSRRTTIDLMLNEAKLKRGQTVVDLGCGDARLLIRAEKKFGTRGIGFEHDPIPYLCALFNKGLRTSNVTIKFKNFFNESLKNADVVFLYLGPEIQKKLAPKLKRELKPGTLIVSNTFHLPTFKPFKKIPKTQEHNTVYVYKIPT